MQADLRPIVHTREQQAECRIMRQHASRRGRQPAEHGAQVERARQRPEHIRQGVDPLQTPFALLVRFTGLPSRCELARQAFERLRMRGVRLACRAHDRYRHP